MTASEIYNALTSCDDCPAGELCTLYCLQGIGMDCVDIIEEYLCANQHRTD